jgi:tRNA 2-thiouridine synthesizing protein B
MAILHTVNKSPFHDSTMSSCLAICSNQDSVIFIEDGVLGAINSSPLASNIEVLASSGTRFYALHYDVFARGIAEKLLPNIKLVSYQDFVKLSVECKQIQSWF